MDEMSKEQLSMTIMCELSVIVLDLYIFLWELCSILLSKTITSNHLKKEGVQLLLSN